MRMIFKSSFILSICLFSKYILANNYNSSSLSSSIMLRGTINEPTFNSSLANPPPNSRLSHQNKNEDTIQTFGFTSYVRCYFYINDQLTTLWGKVFNKDTQQYLYAEVLGSWYSEINPYYNVYYTKVQRDELLNSCKMAFIEAKNNPDEFKSKFIEYSAARWSNSNDSEFWVDTPLQLSVNNSVNSIKRVVVLGDSLSDKHNLLNKMQWYMPNLNGYLHGRFSNGQVWDEYIADYLNANLQVFAEGGSEISPESFEGFVTRSLMEQYNHYLDILKYLPSDFNNQINDSLYVVFIGGNDFINQTARGKANDLAIAYLAIIENLLKLGAKYIMVPIYFDVSIVPEVVDLDAKTPGFAQIVHNDVVLFNQTVYLGLLNLQQSYPQVKFLAPNFNAFLNDELKEFSNIKEACNQAGYTSTPTSKTLCNNVLGYLFWDHIHPTAKGHCHLGYKTNLYMAEQLGLKYPEVMDCDKNYIHVAN